MNIKYIFILLLLPLCIKSQQNIPDFSGETLSEVMKKVDNTFEGKSEIEGLPKYKKYLRWAYWWASRTNDEGKFLDVQNLNQRAILAEKQNRNTGNYRTSTANWQELGPDKSTYANNNNWCVGNGYFRADRITLHPTDPNKIYVCLPFGGLWYSPDKGKNWLCLNDNLAIQGAAGVVVDYDDPNTLYLLTGTSDDYFPGYALLNGYGRKNAYVYKSVDHGKNWINLHAFQDIENILPNRIKMSPLDHDLLVVATSKGLFYSENKGNDWIQSISSNIFDIEFHPTQENRIYYSAFNKINFTDDKFQSNKVSKNLPDCAETARIELAVSPAEPNSVWAILGSNPKTQEFCGIIKSTDKGISFNTISTSPNLLLKEDQTGQDQSFYDLAIAVNPTNPNQVITGGLILYRNLGLSNNPNGWSNSSTFFEPNGSVGKLPDSYVHPDIHDIAISPIDGTTYVASDGGIYSSKDMGASWKNISEGISGGMIYNMNLDPSSANKIAIGMQDNGIKVHEEGDGSDFLHIASGDGYEVAFDFINSNRLAASIVGGVAIWNNYHEDETPIVVEDDPRPFPFSPIKFKLNNTGILYRGNDTIRIIHLYNNGSSVTYGGPGQASWEIETCPVNQNVLYIAGGKDAYWSDPEGSLSVSFDAAANFINRKGNSGWPSGLSKITDIAVHPSNCSVVAFSNGAYNDGQKVFYSPNSGVNWKNISHNLPNVPVHALEIQKNGNIYAGTEIGIYLLSVGKTSWIPFYNNLPRVPITDLTINNQKTKLLAATFGRGVWQSDLANACESFGVFTGVKSGLQFKEVSNTLLSNSIIRGGEGTKIDLHAGQKIILKPGFSTTPGSRFYARIAGCGTQPLKNQ